LSLAAVGLVWILSLTTLPTVHRVSVPAVASDSGAKVDLETSHAGLGSRNSTNSLIAPNISPNVTMQATNQLAFRNHSRWRDQKIRLDPVKLMQSALGLSDDQSKNLEPIFREEQSKMLALRRDTTLSRQARLVKVRDIQQRLESQVKSFLDAEQMEKWRNLRAIPFSHQ